MRLLLIFLINHQEVLLLVIHSSQCFKFFFLQLAQEIIMKSFIISRIIQDNRNKKKYWVCFDDKVRKRFPTISNSKTKTLKMNGKSFFFIFFNLPPIYYATSQTTHERYKNFRAKTFSISSLVETHTIHSVSAVWML